MTAPTRPRPRRGYRVMRFISRLLMRSQIRRIEIVGLENLPKTGPILIVANHFQSLMDPMMIVHASPRPVSFLAKAPLWGSMVLRPFLNASDAVPVYRPQDRHETPGHGARSNVKMFETCHERLRAGAALALFPEGVSKAQPRLMPLRTGAARIAVDLEAPMSIVPVGLVYSPTRRVGRGVALVRFGQPIPVDGEAGYTSRRAAIAGVTRSIESRLRALLAETPSQSEMIQVRFLRRVWDQERKVPPAGTLLEDLERTKRFAQGLHELKAIDPGLVEEVKASGDEFQRTLDLVDLRLSDLDRTYGWGRALRFIGSRLPFLLLAPLAWIAAILTWPARQLGDILALRSMGGSEDVRAVCRMFGGGLLIAILGVLGAVAALLFLDVWWVLVLLVAPAVLALFYVIWRDHSDQIMGRIRAFLLMPGSTLRDLMRTQRREVYEQVEKAVRRLEQIDRERAA